MRLEACYKSMINTNTAVVVTQGARTASGHLGDCDNGEGVHSMSVRAHQSQTLHAPVASRRPPQRGQRRASVSGLILIRFRAHCPLSLSENAAYR